MATNADRHLLFGLLALQNGIIDQGQLVAGFQAWTLDKSRSLADHLEVRGDLDNARRALLDRLAQFHLEAHGGDVERSLAVIAADESIRQDLARIGDEDIDETLGYVDSAQASTEEDPERTGTYFCGTATSNGQRFRVLRPHAHGGLGEVLVALDTELNREVALKRILDRHADDLSSRQRFLVEAEITGGLEHPGIVPVYGLGTYEGGRPYYAMRFIRGDSLKEAIASFHHGLKKATDLSTYSVELRKLLRRFIDVCNAIEYAHSRGVLHRDIKPSNIILGKHGETLVVDWGLAKSRGKSDLSANGDEQTLVPSPSSGSAETLPGTALGTPSYMSPEQARGDLDHLDSRSDVYSLGATLYSLITGKAPFDGRVAEVLDAVRRGGFPLPRHLNPSIHPGLEAICLKALALDPSKRYPSARALADEIDRWMADEPVSARPEGLAGRLARWSRRHRAWVLAGAAALVLVTVVSVVAWAQLSSAQEGNLKLTSSLGLARGQSLCEQGLTGDGLLWLTRALQLCPDSETELERSIRTYIGYWMREVHSLRVQTFGKGKLEALAVAPDGKSAVSCYQGAQALLWDPTSGHPIGSPLADQGGVLSAAFAPDGGRVLTGGKDGTVRLWDTRTGAEIGPAQRLGESVMCLTFSPDGRHAVAGIKNNKARLWDVETGIQVGPGLLLEPNSRWDGFTAKVAFSRDGRKLLTASFDGHFRLWNAADGTPDGTEATHPKFAFSASLSGDARRVLTVGPDGGQVWNLEAGMREGPMLTHHEAALVGAFHPEKPWVAIGFNNGSTLIWDFDAQPAKVVARIELGGSVKTLAFTPDGRAIVTGSDDGTARLWEVPSGRPLGGPLYHPSRRAVTHIAVSGDGRRIVTGCEDGGLRSWVVGPSRSFDPSLPNGDEVWITTFSPDGKLVLTGGGKQPLRVWDSQSGRPVGKPMEQDWVKCAAFSPDSKFVMVGSYPSVARIWDVQSGALIRERTAEHGDFAAAAHNVAGFEMLQHRPDGSVIVIDPEGETSYHGLPAAKGGVHAATLSCDGTTAAVGGPAGEVRVWNVLTGQSLAGIQIPEVQVEALSLSADGRIAMAGFKDGTARVWEVGNGKIIGRVLNHSGRIRSVALSPDGRLAATGAGDQAIRLWETVTGLPSGPAYPTAGAVIAVAFSPDGRLILSGDGDNAAKFWDVATIATESENRLARRASTMANLEFDPAGNLIPLTPDRWRQLKSDDQESVSNEILK